MSRPNPEKVAREANRDFHLRRHYRAIRKSASQVDPNSGFRLSTKAMAQASGILASIARLEEERKAEAARLAAISKRDRLMAQREAGTTQLPSRRR